MEYLQISYQKEAERSYKIKQWTILFQAGIALLPKRDVSVTRTFKLVRVIWPKIVSSAEGSSEFR